MNLRKVESYNVGLDIGTGSVGWAVTDANGDLCHFKGKPTWGSRLFPSAETAEKARLPRGQRRRYVRRRWRLNLLQGIFAEEMAKADPEFFIRLRQSRLWPEDREEGHSNYQWPLFNGGDFNEVDYYGKFPTVYHLRAWLTKTDEKADIRLVYLALHNIVKHRGNFLREGERLCAKNANMQVAIDKLCDALEAWCEANEMPVPSPKKKAIREALEKTDLSKSEMRDIVGDLFGFDKDEKKFSKAVSNAIVGLQAEMKDVFGADAEGIEKTKIYLSKDDDVDAFLEACQDEWLELFEAMRATYSAFILSGMLSNRPGETISVNKVAEYERYGSDLAMLKALVKEYARDSYDEFFRGAHYAGSLAYDPAEAKGYTKYNLGVKKLSYEDFGKEVKKLFAGTAAEGDERYAAMVQGLDKGVFLRRLKTSDNGSIPYQLHLEELLAIVKNQGKHYPFLRERGREIESLITFRIPYYVGPLTQKNARYGSDGKPRFAWSERKPGQEDAKIYPWNWEEVIDKHGSAEAFIHRMTGTCTYLHGEPVLPKCSLLYEEFCVLNELNGAKWSQDGDSFHRFDAADREGLVKELFCQRKVSYKAVADWMAQRGHSNVHVSGGQGETGFESKMASHIFFCKDIFHVDELPVCDIPMIEKIILWNTLFEDRKILSEKLQEEYGDRLSPEQIKKICKKRFAGWGRLSEAFLCEVKVSTDAGPKSIMDVLREGDPNNGRHRSVAMVLMEVLHDDNLAFGDQIEERNAQRAKEQGGLSIDDLPGSPALRRGVNQAMRIVEEIAGIVGKPPANVFVEVTREEDAEKKGLRTKRRYDRLKEALEAFKKEDPQVWKELNARSHGDIDERLTLYFMQRGKSLYSQKALDIDRLSDYEVDHILPQSYIKDDSFENKALVLKAENQRKLDTLLLDDSIRMKCKGYWKELLDAGLIGKKKYQNLMRREVREKEMKGFIARQLVETSQVVKFVEQMISQKFEGTRVIPIKAGISSQLRKKRGFAKCREANDYHHAHDAYLACQVGRFMLKRHSQAFDNPVGMAKTVRQFIQSQGQEYSQNRKMPDSSFMVGSFLRSGFDKETGEIFKDDWNAEGEVDRIRKCLNYADCFISRMPEETSGAFWDATIYSPHGGKRKPGIPIKRGLPVEKYGGYSGKDYGFFFVYSGVDSRGRTKAFLDGVPLRLAAKIRSNQNALEAYADELIKAKGLSQAKVLKNRILKYQKICQGEDTFYITGESEVRNAKQIALTQHDTALLKEAISTGAVEKDSLIRIYAVIAEKAYKMAPRIASVLKLHEREEVFASASIDEMADVLVKILQVLNAVKTQVDLSAIKGSVNSGVIRWSLPKLDDLVFVDQSVTGMFERRYKLEL